MIVLKLKALQLKILKFEELERETRFELANSTLARKNFNKLRLLISNDYLESFFYFIDRFQIQL